MASIVLTWELGGGLGHILPLRALSDALSARGHRVVMVLRDMSAHRALHGAAAAIMQAPTAPERPKLPIDPPYTFAHLLYNCGFDDPSALRLRVQCWLTLFEYVRPDLVVLDHSPTALVALGATAIKRIPFGVGFSIPVDEYPLRSMREYPAADPDKLRADEDLVLQTINRLLPEIGAAPIDRLAQLYANVDDRFLTTFRELDPYRDRGDARYWGTAGRGMGTRPSWPELAGPRIYCYLKPFGGFTTLLGLLKEIGAATVIVGDGLDPSFAERYGGGNIRFEPSAVDIEAAARECDVAILNATHGTTANLLLAGKPVLMLPLTQEQFMTAVRVEQLGAGISVPFFDAQELQASLQAVLNLASYRRRAEEFAARYKSWTTERQVAAMADRIEELLKDDGA